MLQRELQSIAERLLRGGVAPRHVQRYLRELGEHYEDALSAELGRGTPRAAAERAAWARLGSHDSLVQSMLERPELRGAGARFPALVFGAGPVLVWLAIVVATVAVLRLASASAVRAEPPAWLPLVARAIFILYVRVLPMLLGVIVFVSAARRRLRLSWPIASAALVNVLAGTLTINVLGAVVGVSSALLPMLVPFSDVFGPKDLPALADGLWRAVWMLAVSAAIYFASARRWAA